ncbi:hypothetical protein GCU67_13420 [Modestobacter muralis]|uniref:Uncharacterized protein n=1 Tax=Modestobacter muralis TaxID=1608614 RepID=A0A6P0EU01_9ACTN|nr:hypothetical protein [Modestobacter muralis]NEK95162.1 hypothetical protein [Modestobacter muralis]NEN52050.1 hypothetical protein [Modestobacter muralis]
MRFRSNKRDQRSWPTGRAEVELFTFWENDLAVGSPSPRDPGLIAHMVPQLNSTAAPASSSLKPLWWALGIAGVLMLLAVVL